jgi:hypothetical protein
MRPRCAYVMNPGSLETINIFMRGAPVRRSRPPRQGFSVLGQMCSRSYLEKPGRQPRLQRFLLYSTVRIKSVVKIRLF